MQKISIKNFGPIDSIENLEVSRVLLLIGQQASGKSTISKLIYFFKSLREDVLVCLEEHEYVNKLSPEYLQDTLQKFLFKAMSRFYTFFGSTKDEKFQISYQFNTNHNLVVIPNSSGSVDFTANEKWFSKSFFDIIKKWNNFLTLNQRVRKNIPYIKEGTSDALLRRKEERKIDDLKREIDRLIDQIFGEENANYPRLFFIPAGRSLLSSLKQSFQNKLIQEFASLRQLEELFANNYLQQNKEFHERRNYFDFFVGNFFENIDEVKNKILFGKTLDDVIEEFELLESRPHLIAREFLIKMRAILKADYQVNSFGERLLSTKFKKPILLDYASSGQQEVIWILLQLFSLILEDQPSFVVIEEPEAHLYPTAQVEVMNLIALFLSANVGNQVIITTHSPYMLTAANNLLFAHRVEAKSGNDPDKSTAIKEVMGTDAWLDPSNFGAYYLSEDKIVSIFSKDTGVISESELDNASEAIMDKFDDLMDIYKSER
jgi:predicted ATPase